LKLRVELRGIAQGNLPRQKTLQTEAKPGRLGHWTSLTFGGNDYKDFGEVTAWRVTLWTATNSWRAKILSLVTVVPACGRLRAVSRGTSLR